ncbi:MAG TPA: ABC transporter permease [Rectinemataceae bacterium]|nr:ABC transporter permease [Rectinemataceae bacterium]
MTSPFARRTGGLTFVFSVAGGLLLAFILIPIVRMYATHDLKGLMRAAGEPDVLPAIRLSLEAAFITATFAGAFGIPLAYLLAKKDFLGKGIVEALVDLPLAIPHTVVGIALLFVFGRSGIIGAPIERLTGFKFWGTLGGIVISMLFVSLPHMVNSARIGFESVDSRLEKVARTLGRGPWFVLAKVTLPLARRGILTGLMLTYARSISEFGAVVILAYFPMTAPVKIYDLFLQSGLDESSAVAVIFMTVALALFIILRWISRLPGADRKGRR